VSRTWTEIVACSDRTEDQEGAEQRAVKNFVICVPHLIKLLMGWSIEGGCNMRGDVRTASFLSDVIIWKTCLYV